MDDMCNILMKIDREQHGPQFLWGAQNYTNEAVTHSVDASPLVVGLYCKRKWTI